LRRRGAASRRLLRAKARRTDALVGMNAPEGASEKRVGPHNSSITRVRPVFSALLSQDPSGRSWLGRLLEATEPGRRVLARLNGDPGGIDETFTVLRPFAEGSFGQLHLAQCFEREVAPSDGMLRWLIEHPQELTWPRSGRPFRPDTERRRRALVGADPTAREQVQREALDELQRLGPRGSEGCWWAFEGFTSVDCWIETERLVLLVEGKRDEPLSPATHWYPRRSQLVRNLEAACDAAGQDREAGVLLAVEREIREPLTERGLRASAPHLETAAIERLRSAYLGQLTWSHLCDALGLRPEVLPDTVEENYRDGELTGFEQVAKYETPELAYLVEVERFKAKVGGRQELAPVALRVRASSDPKTTPGRSSIDTRIR
jgi:hypothetical protein